MSNTVPRALQVSRTENVKWVIVRVVMHRGSPEKWALNPPRGFSAASECGHSSKRVSSHHGGPATTACLFRLLSLLAPEEDMLTSEQRCSSGGSVLSDGGLGINGSNSVHRHRIYLFILGPFRLVRVNFYLYLLVLAPGHLGPQYCSG